MKDAIYITNLQPVTREVLESSSLRDEHFELFLVTSSAEIDIVNQSAAMRVINAVRPKLHQEAISFLSIGCAGLFACILEFLQTDARNARVLLLETPADFVQATLDLANIGTGGDGFIAQDVSYVVDLSRSPAAGALRVAYCEILARPPALSGTAKLAVRILTRLRAIMREFPEARVVTFENCSEWSRRLAQTLSVLAPLEGVTLDWLPSVENDRQHFMTVRPLLDLAANLSNARMRPLVLTCLGAGGRFGILALSPDHDCGKVATATGMPKHLGQVVVRRSDRDTRGAPQKIFYMQNEYYGLENFYFKWNVDLEGAQSA
ncbi:MAG: hypothetical protein JO309_01590 [Pseudonocardiales bacterium]|nr:hypothetical protein [Hyphomicrobiales bacterium]MBV8825514.1 hypothetical protein [Hyphomicrobiales bacterium]MBV9429440.1 hypothetical protein [Bradyrhizobiaceae bacterium]MBV9728108.1 hypothetical protein [Pseudonocardiales bacterium]